MPDARDFPDAPDTADAAAPSHGPRSERASAVPVPAASIRRSARGAAISIALVGLVGAACGGEGRPAGAPGPSEPESPARFSTSLDVSPPLPAAGERFEATARYAIEPRSDHLGAYVAELRFDPNAVRFVAADPGLGDGRVVNPLRAEAGSLVLAGASGDGFLDGLLFRGTFEALAVGVGPVSFSLHVREASDTGLARLIE